jgi:hypothetical protein
MAVFETLFILTGLFMGFVSQGGMFLFLLPLAVVAFVLAIMNRPRPTGSKAKKIVSSILSAAYLVAVIVCLLTFFKGGSKESEEVPYDLERIKAEIAMHDDELIECDPTKEKGCMEFTIYGTRSDSNRFYTVSLHWELPRFQVYPKRVHRKIIKGLLGDDLTDADTVLDSEHLGEIHKRALYRQAEEYKRSIESELRNYPGDWYHDSAHTKVAATLKYERRDSIDVAFDSLLWTTYYVSNAGYNAGAAGGYNYVYHRTFSKKDGSLVDSTIFNPNEKKAIVLLLRKYAEKYDARADAIGMDFNLEPSFLKDGIGFDGLSFEIGWHTHGSVMIVVPYNEILPYMEAWARKIYGFN